MNDIREFISNFMNNNRERIPELLAMSFDDLAKELIAQGLFKDEESIKCFILDASLSLLGQGEFDLPIGYYDEDEKFEGTIDTKDEALTDEYVNHLKIVK